METIALTPAKLAVVSRLAERYLWWEAIAPEGHTTSRMIAQIMHLGTYDDIRQLERLLGPATLATVLRQSQPGWFDDRSWDFWRGRLIHAGETGIPSARPKRTFDHAGVL